jgi:signal transduction histidine kinase
MSRFLVIQDGKDAELESVLVEKQGRSDREFPGQDAWQPGAADSAPATSSQPSLSVKMKTRGADEVVFGLHDLLGHSVELSLPLNPLLVGAKEAVQRKQGGATTRGFFEALASEITSPQPPERPLTIDAFKHENGRRHSGKRSRSLRSLELARLQNEADRAMLILRTVLQLASRDAAPGFRRLRLESVLSRAIRRHNLRYPERTFKVVGHSSHLALAEPRWMDLVLALLLNDAERYVPQGHAFEIDSFDDGDKCSIAFVDQTGAEHLELSLGLWDLQDPGEDLSNERVRGSGMSLSLGRQLIESMHGEVWCGHRRRGGSAFVISLPRARPAPRPRAKVVSLRSRMPATSKSAV